MKTEHSYIKCELCPSWDIGRRIEYMCPLCNNAGMVINPAEILCNRCGGAARKENSQYPLGLENCKIGGNYDNYHLLDGVEYSFNLCELCLRQMFMEFKIPPQVDDKAMANDPKFSFMDDQDIYEFRIWFDSGGHHQAYVNRKCNALKDCPNRAEYSVVDWDEFSEECRCEEHKGLINHGSDLVKFIPHTLRAFL
jgi:hypothetical protein